MTPTRIQRTYTTPYPTDGTTLTADRTGPFGNPHRITKGKASGGFAWYCDGQGFLLREAATKYAVAAHRADLDIMRDKNPDKFSAMIEQVQAAKYIACWCKISDCCHADNWIWYANQPRPDAGQGLLT